MGLTSHLPELMIVLVIALLFFGPSKLPQIGGAIGQSIREFKKGTSDLAHSLEEHTEHASSVSSTSSSADEPLVTVIEPVAVSAKTAERERIA